MILKGWQAAGPQRDWREGAVLLLLFAIEAMVFLHYARREILWHQPEFYDQAMYLIRSYQIEDSLRAGDWHGVFEGLTRQIDSALPLEGAGLALIFGGSRVPRLFVNLMLLCLAQLMVFITLRSLTGRSLYGFAAIGLLLSQAFLFQPAGGVFDFRFDFAAACLFGVWLCTLLSADQRSLAAGLCLTTLAGFALLLHRLVAGVHMLPVLVVLTVLCAVNVGTARTAEGSLRLQHASLSLLLTLLMIGGYAALRWPAISDYYIEGHLVGDEKIARAHEMGLYSLVDHVTFYLKSLLEAQLGAGFVILAGLGLVIAASVASSGRRQADAIGLCVAATVLPLAALTIDVSKSAVVASVAAIPAALAVCLICFSCGEKRRAAVIMTSILFMLGGAGTAAMRVNEPVFTVNRAAFETSRALARDVARQIADNGWQQPIYLSVDAMTSRINVPALDALIREQTGKLHNLQMALGARVDAVGQADMEAELSRSQLLVTTPHAGAGPLPFDRSMKTLHSAFEARVKQDFRAVGTYGEGPDKLTLYVRRTVPDRGTQDLRQ